jgi:hypothetical protein
VKFQLLRVTLCSHKAAPLSVYNLLITPKLYRTGQPFPMPW